VIFSTSRARVTEVRSSRPKIATRPWVSARPPALPPRWATRASSPSPAGRRTRVLLFGPLPHLTAPAHRQQALAEARWVLAIVVCRFASLLDGLYQGWLDDPDFRPIVDQDLADGQHRNPDPVGRPEFFTTAYFHTPGGLAQEIEQAGFAGVAVYGSRARAGRCASSGPIRGGESRSCSQHARLRHSPAYRLQRPPDHYRSQAVAGPATRHVRALSPLCGHAYSCSLSSPQHRAAAEMRAHS
jgi:hypothetical protein